MPGRDAKEWGKRQKKPDTTSDSVNIRGTNTFDVVIQTVREPYGQNISTLEILFETVFDTVLPTKKLQRLNSPQCLKYYYVPQVTTMEENLG